MTITPKNQKIAHLKSTTALILLTSLGICVMNTSFSNSATAEPTTTQNTENCKTTDQNCKHKNSFQMFVQSLINRFFGSENSDSSQTSEDRGGSGAAVENNTATTSNTTPDTTSPEQPAGTPASGSGGSTPGEESGSSAPTGTTQNNSPPTETGANLLSGTTKPSSTSQTGGTPNKNAPAGSTQPQGTQTLPQAVIVQPHTITPFQISTTPPVPQGSGLLDLNNIQIVIVNENNQQTLIPLTPTSNDGFKVVTTTVETSGSFSTGSGHVVPHGYGITSLIADKDTNPGAITPQQNTQPQGMQPLPQAVIVQPQIITVLPFATFTPTTPAVPPSSAPAGSTMPLLNLNNNTPTVTGGQLTVNDSTTSSQPSTLADWAAVIGQFNGTVAGGTTTSTSTIILPGGVITPGGTITTDFSTPTRSASYVVNGQSTTTFGTGSFASSNTLYNSDRQRIGIVTNAMPQILSTAQTYNGYVYDQNGTLIGAYMNGLYFAYADGKWYQALLNKAPVTYVQTNSTMITRFLGAVPTTQITVNQERQSITNSVVKQKKTTAKTSEGSTDIVYIDEDSGLREDRNSVRDQGKTSSVSIAPAIIAPPPDDNF